MYYQYFGLTEAPFSIAVNPRYLYMSPRHRDALAHLLYGVGAGGGFILLTGEVGTGKTTINRCLLEQLPDKADIAIVLNPALDSRDLLATVCEELGIEFAESRPGLKELTDGLHRYLLANHTAGRKTVLMIDEAQHLGFEVLEQIRLLTNLETNDEKLLHIILIGQPELAAKLARPELRQLNQRITARFNLQPLNLDETRAYIRHRLQVAGKPAGQELFPARLVRAIHRKSRGVPRLINLLCDRMLLGAYGRDSVQLDHSLLRQAAREVLGDMESPRGPSRWRLPLAGAAAGTLVTVALWLLLAGSEKPGEPPAAIASEPQGLPAPAASTAPFTTRDTAKQQAPQARVSSVVERSTIPSTGSAAWRLAPQTGAAALAALYGAPAPERANPCAAELGSRLACEQLELDSWNELLSRGRPALLALLDARRFESVALLVDLDGEDALLVTQSGAQRVPLERLATEWTGVVWQLWRKPLGMQRTLQRGDTGADVARAAMLFARLDGQAQPLSEGLFNDPLEARVQLFQRRQGLRADGVMGANTLRALALAAGEDMGFAEARQRVAENALGDALAGSGP